MRIMLDSGAYSAWTQGVEVDLDEYITYIKRNAACISTYVNLDVIAGGQRESRPEQIESAAARSYANQQAMKDAGLRPIPVFHEDERWCWLERYLDDGEPYVGLAAKSQQRQEAIRWLDGCFDLIANGSRPLIKVHGFGLTALLICQRYPWATVDSSRWAKAAGFGLMPIPVWINGRPDYSVQPTTVSLSRAGGHKHVDTLDDWELDRVRRYLNDVVGIDMAEARYSPVHRWRAWITYFQGVETMCSGRLCSPLLQHASQQFRPADHSFQIAFVTDTTRKQAELLAECGVQRRLLSFYKLKDQPDATLEDYVAGRMRPAKPRRKQPMDWYSDRYIASRKLAVYQRLKGYEGRME